MRATTIPLWFKLFYNFLFLLFPPIILTNIYGWIWGMGGYFIFLAVFLGLSSRLNNKKLHLIFTWISALPFILAFYLVFGMPYSVIACFSLSLFFLSLNYWRYKKDLYQIKQQRIGIPINFQFPDTAPKGIEKTVESYFNPESFDLETLPTQIIPLSLTYKVEKQEYQQEFEFYWHDTPWESNVLAEDYALQLSGQVVSLKYAPDNPRILQKNFSANYLSTFEAFIKQEIGKCIWSSLFQFSAFSCLILLLHYHLK